MAMTLSSALVLQGCTIIETSNEAGSSKIQVVLFAPVVLKEDGADGMRLNTIAGVGLLSQGGSYVLGAFKSRTSRMDGGCRIVLVGNTERELMTLSALIGGLDKVCVEPKFRKDDHAAR